VAFRDTRGVLVLHSLSSGKRQAVQATETGDQPIGWSEDGRYLYAQTLNAQKSAARDGRSAHVCLGGFPTTIVKIDLRQPRRQVMRTIQRGASGSSCLGVIRISADGKTVAYQTAEILSDLYLVRGVH
jgi:hypothetical protein